MVTGRTFTVIRDVAQFINSEGLARAAVIDLEHNSSGHLDLLYESDYQRTGHSYGEDDLAVGPDYATIPLTQDLVADPNSDLFPDQCTLSAIDFVITEVATATSVFCYLSEDEDGTSPLTPLAEVEWFPGKPADTFFASYLIEREFDRDVGEVGIAYLQAYLDAGTAHIVARLRWRP